MGSYVTFDSLDAGRRWHTRPPGIGSVGCVPPNSDGGLSRLDCIPPNSDGGLAYLDDALDIFSKVVAPITASALTAGGAVGAALINADASKYAIKQQTKTDLLIALAKQKSDLEQAQALLDAQRITQEETTKRTEITTKATANTTTNIAPILGILGLAGIAALVILNKD
jgi:hypothetical protein